MVTSSLRDALENPVIFCDIAAKRVGVGRGLDRITIFRPSKIVTCILGGGSVVSVRVKVNLDNVTKYHIFKFAFRGKFLQ